MLKDGTKQLSRQSQIQVNKVVLSNIPGPSGLFSTGPSNETRHHEQEEIMQSELSDDSEYIYTYMQLHN